MLSELYLREYSDLFAESSTDWGHTHLIQHKINTENSPPFKQRPRHLPLSQRQAEREEVNKMLSSGVTEESESPRASIQKGWVHSLLSVDSRNFEMWGQFPPMSEKCGGLVNKNGNFYIRQRGINFGSICLSVCLLCPCSTKGLSPDPVCDP